MMEALPKRPYNAATMSTSHRDITDDRYRDLRRPRKVVFLCNGDRYFKGKKVNITPHRYLTFNDLLNDLTGKLPNHVQLPYGVRQIYTPVTGRRIRDIEELQDGQTYVCGGFETFKPIKYGTASYEPWSVGKPHNHEFFADPSTSQQIGFNTGPSPYGRGYYGAFQPTKPIRNSFGTVRRPAGTFGQRGGPTSYWGGGFTSDNSSHMKPKVITVVRNGEKNRANVKILLNRRSVQSYEQLVKDITEAFGSKFRGNRIRKIFTIKGREVQGISDFFREDDVFIGIGNEQLTTSDVQDILEDLYPDSPYAKNLLKEWDRTRKRYQLSYKTKEQKLPKPTEDDDLASKFDSGLGSDASNRDDGEETTSIKVKGKKKKSPRDIQQPIEEEELATRLERERMKAAEAERDRARRRMQKRLDAERRALDEERRKRGLVPLRPLNDPFKRMQEERDKEQREERKRRQEAQEKEEEERRRRLAAEAEREIEAEREAERKREQERLRELQRQKREEEEREKEQKLEKEKEEKRKRREAEERARARSRNAEPEEPKVIVVVKDDDRSSKASPRGDAKSSPSRTPKAQVKVSPTPSPTRHHHTDSLEVQTPKTKSKSSDRVKTKDNKLTEKDEGKEREDKDNDVPKKRAEKDREDNSINKEKEQMDAPKDNEKKKKPKKQGIIRKSKLERQISNVEYVLDKYEIGKTLGDGNFALVKQSRLKNTSQDYAMKVIDKSKLKGKEHMIENEIEIMKRCSQPNIVKLHEEFETKDEIYLVMELVKGGDLFDAITQSVKFSEPVAASMVADLSNALFYLHSREIVHRDLKPENLLVCRNKDGSITLKLADFGLAMEVHELIYTVCGTPTYVAPEILSETGYGLEVDMWATGVITYILLCGFPPFRSPDRNQTELFEFIKAGEFEFLSPYWDKISKSAKDLISKLLVVDRNKRYTAVQTLCHPWTITVGGSVLPPAQLDEYRQNLKRELESQARINLQNYKLGKYS